MHLLNFHKKHAVSPIIATVILIALVLAASTVVAVIFMNINVVNLSSYLGGGTSTKKAVSFSIYIWNITDSDGDGENDTIEFYLSLSPDSPDIYVSDADVLLPTGKTLDQFAPWYLDSLTQEWNEEVYGFAVSAGTINATFTIKCSDLSNNNAELESGQGYYLLINYNYIVEEGNRVRITSETFQTVLFYS
ncbi:MAG: archaellin/type IV pilin N-terminal domain-containing protein [Candidatus Heimdallarchaeaceae archaeon]